MNSDRVMYVLSPYRKELKPVMEALNDAAKTTGFHCTTAREDDAEPDIVRRIINGIHSASIVIADLTYLSPNVLYELGVANALSKDCLMICQSGTAPYSWVISEESDHPGGRLPFDLSRFDVSQYQNTPAGLEALRENLVRRIETGVPNHPVNAALLELVKRNRVLTYACVGAVGGWVLGFLASLLPAALGTALDSPWYPGTFHTLVSGALAGAISGALHFSAFALLFNWMDSKVPRPLAVVAHGLAGGIAGLIVFGSTYFMNVTRHTAEAARGMGLAYLILLLFTGLAIGVAFTLQPYRVRREALQTVATRASLAAFVAAIGFIVVVIFGRDALFPEGYAREIVVSGAVSDAARFGLWVVLAAILQWWLRWRRGGP